MCQNGFILVLHRLGCETDSEGSWIKRQNAMHGESPARLGSNGETDLKFFFGGEATIGIFWWPASFLFFLKLEVHVGATNA